MGHSEGTDSIHDADHLIFLYSFSPTSPLYLSSYIPLYILIPLTRFPIPNQIRNSPPFPNVLTTLLHPIRDWPRGSKLFILFLSSWKTILYGNPIWIQNRSTGCIKSGNIESLKSLCLYCCLPLRNCQKCAYKFCYNYLFVST